MCSTFDMSRLCRWWDRVKEKSLHWRESYLNTWGFFLLYWEEEKYRISLGFILFMMAEERFQIVVHSHITIYKHSYYSQAVTFYDTRHSMNKKALVLCTHCCNLWIFLDSSQPASHHPYIKPPGHFLCCSLGGTPTVQWKPERVWIEVEATNQAWGNNFTATHLRPPGQSDDGDNW